MQLCMMEDQSLAVSAESGVDPGHQRADFGVDAREVRQRASRAPGDDPLQRSVTHQRTSRVALRGRRDHIWNLFPDAMLLCDQVNT